MSGGKSDGFARLLAVLSLAVGSGGLWLGYKNYDRLESADAAAEQTADLQSQAEQFLLRLYGQPYVRVDDMSIDAYISSVLPLYKNPLEYHHDARPEELGHDGIVARYRAFLEPLRSLGRMFQDVQIESIAPNRYRITAVGVLDRTYQPGEQPGECGEFTRFIQRVDVELNVEIHAAGDWLLVSARDSTQPNSSDCRHPS